MNNPELNDDGIPVNSTDSVCVTTIEFQPVDSLEEANDRDSVLIADDLTTIPKISHTRKQPGQLQTEASRKTDHPDIL